MSNEIMSVEGQLIGMPLAGPESFSQQQLDYLKRALGVDETVLWEGASTVTNALQNGAGLTLSESPFNFEYIEVHWVPWAYSETRTIKQEAVAKAFVTSERPRIGMVNEWTDEDQNAVFLFIVNAYFTDSKFYTTSIKYFMIDDLKVNSTGNGTYITKIVGIHRIAGGN